MRPLCCLKAWPCMWPRTQNRKLWCCNRKSICSRRAWGNHSHIFALQFVENLRVSLLQNTPLQFPAQTWKKLEYTSRFAYKLELRHRLEFMLLSICRYQTNQVTQNISARDRNFFKTMRLLPLHLTPSSSLENLNCHLKIGFLLKRKEKKRGNNRGCLHPHTLKSDIYTDKKETLWQVHLRKQGKWTYECWRTECPREVLGDMDVQHPLRKGNSRKLTEFLQEI